MLVQIFENLSFELLVERLVSCGQLDGLQVEEAIIL